MTHFFEKRDPWGNGPAMWIVAALVLLAPLTWWALKDIHLENDVANWLPKNDPRARTLAWHKEYFGHEDRVFISWDSSSLFDPRVEQLAKALQGAVTEDGVRKGGVPHVESVLTPKMLLSQMTRRGIEPEEAQRRLEGVLIGRGLLKVRLTDTGRARREQTIAQLQAAALDQLKLKIEVAPSAIQLVEEALATQDFDKLAAEAEEDAVPLEAAIAAWSRPHDLQLRWRNMQVEPELVERVQKLAADLRAPPTAASPAGEPLIAECFFQRGAPIAVAATLSEAGSAEKRAAFEAIRAAAERVGIPAAEIHLGGRPVAGAALNTEVKKTAWNADYPWRLLHKRSPLLLSALVGVVLSISLLRNVPLALLVLGITFYTTLLAVAVVPVTGGSMNMVLVVMPTLLMVLSLSGAIHVANYWRHAAAQNLRSAVVSTCRMAAVPCALASLTTALGLVSLMTSPLTPVRDFGLYSAIGCVIGLLMVLFALPALLQYWPVGTVAVTQLNAAPWQRFGEWLARRQRVVLGVCLAAFAAGAAGLQWFRTETKVIRFFPDDSQVVADYRFLEENLTGVVPVDLVVRFDSAEQKRSNFMERLEVVRAIQEEMRRNPNVSGTLSLADFQPVYEPLPEGASVRQRMLHHKKISQTEKLVKEESEAARAFLVTAAHSSDLYEPGDGLLNGSGDELWRITAQVSILSNLDYADLTAQLNDVAQSHLKYKPGASHLVTGLVPVFLRTQQAVLESLIESFALAFVLIGGVMVVLLRNPLAGLLSMLPNVLPVAMVFGLISWGGIAVDMGTMITASVAMGIAVDGTLHLLTWFREGIREGGSRQQAVCRALGHCGPALCQTSLAVGLGLLVLAGSDLLLISRFGWLMALLIGSALLADIVFLPVLLLGPLGWLIERSVLGTANAPEPVEMPYPGSLAPAPHMPLVSNVARTGSVIPAE